MFESFTTAQIIAYQLALEGFATEDQDQKFEAVAQILDDPNRKLIGAHLKTGRGTFLARAKRRRKTAKSALKEQ